MNFCYEHVVAYLATLPPPLPRSLSVSCAAASAGAVRFFSSAACGGNSTTVPLSTVGIALGCDAASAVQTTCVRGAFAPPPGAGLLARAYFPGSACPAAGLPDAPLVAVTSRATGECLAAPAAASVLAQCTPSGWSVSTYDGPRCEATPAGAQSGAVGCSTTAGRVGGAVSVSCASVGGSGDGAGFDGAVARGKAKSGASAASTALAAAVVAALAAAFVAGTAM